MKDRDSELKGRFVTSMRKGHGYPEMTHKSHGAPTPVVRVTPASEPLTPEETFRTCTVQDSGPRKTGSRKDRTVVRVSVTKTVVGGDRSTLRQRPVTPFQGMGVVGEGETTGVVRSLYGLTRVEGFPVDTEDESRARVVVKEYL